MFDLIKKIISHKNETSKVTHHNEGTWSVLANIKKEIPYGPEGSEIKSGLKKFKAGAKVHIIDAFYGTCEHIVVIGQHRHSGKYISCVIKVDTVKNLRVKKVYSRKVLKLLERGTKYNCGAIGFPTQKKLKN